MEALTEKPDSFMSSMKRSLLAQGLVDTREFSSTEWALHPSGSEERLLVIGPYANDCQVESDLMEPFLVWQVP